MDHLSKKGVLYAAVLLGAPGCELCMFGSRHDFQQAQGIQYLLQVCAFSGEQLTVKLQVVRVSQHHYEMLDVAVFQVLTRFVECRMNTEAARSMHGHSLTSYEVQYKDRAYNTCMSRKF